ncbi:hypothetical protein [Streptococcus suis]|uniref:hypothetical protein n=1 Tax=Streptococcus suis TaxID=1307 RepID=UPI003758116F
MSSIKNAGNKEAGQKAQRLLLRVRVNISAQWLIVRFIRVSHSKSDHYDCCEQSSLHLQPPTVTTLTVGAMRGWE